MAGFRHSSRKKFDYDNPWEMYADRKNRKIQSLYDHQREMLARYMEFGLNESDVSLELPTGSGKTLVGLLIGDFRRQKKSEKVVYCCTNKYLVHQVCELASAQYGIDARPFIGSKSQFAEKDKTDFASAKCIAVTTYSSLFNCSPYFQDAQLLIFDDAHAAESQVASCWDLTVNVDDEESASLFHGLVEALRPLLENAEYRRLNEGDESAAAGVSVGFIPGPALFDYQESISDAIEKYLAENRESAVCYVWRMIKGHLVGCGVYFTSSTISIRPVIPPTATFAPMNNARQRLYMSATLGETGELERAFGRGTIYSLPVAEEWRDRTTGRRLFLFPTAFDGANEVSHDEILKMMLLDNQRALLLTDSLYSQEELSLELENIRPVFKANELQGDKSSFLASRNGVLIAANRLDGLDFPNEECRLEIIHRLPRAVDLQERFLVNSVLVRDLYSERIRNRLTQALGRCTRGQTDYAVVHILDESVKDEITSPNIRKMMNCELQAEIEFALDNLEHDSLEEYLELASIFLNERDEWEEFEQGIAANRSQIAKDMDTFSSHELEILKKAAPNETRASLYLWNGDLGQAITAIDDLLLVLGEADALGGYYAFWSYIKCYCMIASGSSSDASREEAKDCFDLTKEKALPGSWVINRLPSHFMERHENENVLERLTGFLRTKISQAKSTSMIYDEIDALCDELRTEPEGEFEAPHTELGKWLGYESSNPSGDAEPDPYWIIDSKCCIVSEDKIYEAADKAIPVKHVRQAAGHKNWVREKLGNKLDKDAEIITVFITTAEQIEENAKIHADGIWYLKRDDFAEWASKALGAIRKSVAYAPQKSGDDLGRALDRELVNAKVTSQDFIEFVKRKHLKNIRGKKR